MKHVFNQTPLYKFLSYCNHEGLEGIVLDCGAGGRFPPLALFKQFGYQTYGVELNDDQIKKASIFASDHNLALNISKGDIRKLPFNDHSINYIYSYNTIFHMKKDDIIMSIDEMKRVLKTGGLCFINFLSIHDEGFGEGENLEKRSFLQLEDGQPVVHTYYEIDEAEDHFRDMNIIYKENRVVERLYEGEKIKQGYIDYIFKK